MEKLPQLKRSHAYCFAFGLRMQWSIILACVVSILDILVCYAVLYKYFSFRQYFSAFCSIFWCLKKLFWRTFKDQMYLWDSFFLMNASKSPPKHLRHKVPLNVFRPSSLEIFYEDLGMNGLTKTHLSLMLNPFHTTGLFSITIDAFTSFT